MCRAEGMGVAPWGALGAGLFKTVSEEGSSWKAVANDQQKEQREKDSARKAIVPPTANEIAICEKLEEMAKRKGTLMTSIAQSYVMHKQPYVFPIVGVRTLGHLKGNIEALKVSLTREEIDELEAVVPFDYGFPNSLFAVGGRGSDVSGNETASDSFGNTMFVRLREVGLPQPIQLGQPEKKKSTSWHDELYVKSEKK
jgi:hypothetical protein